MIYLHDGGGAAITEFRGPALRPDEWAKIRSGAGKLLDARGHKTAAEILRSFPFELLDATNYFQDEFSALRATVDLEKYIELETRKRESKDDFTRIAKTLTEVGPFVRYIVAVLETEVVEIVRAPSLEVTTESVSRALGDAEQLLQTQGAASALDRVHTAFHGYLKQVCKDADLALPKDASIVDAFKALRAEHPNFRAHGARAEETKKIINATASIVDALNVLRNKASVAHPSDEILGDPEAMLAINAARTLLHYVDTRLRT